MKKNEMFESMLKASYIAETPEKFYKHDMELMYNHVVFECIKVARQHVLDKFGIKEPFDGTTEIEKALSKHFEAEHMLEHVVKHD
jgi:hypothetical protein